MWDWMFNLQLWSASGLAQIVKWMIPYGWIWTPILDDVSGRSNLREFPSIDCFYGDFCSSDYLQDIM